MLQQDMPPPLIPGRPETAPEEIGRRLRLLREAHGLSIRKFAALVGSDASAISKAEKGNREVSKEMLLNLYFAIEGSADFILYGRRGNINADLLARIRDLERKT